MSTVVIMPGGFHPFHAGHYALYQSALNAFPGADVYVAATNDQSERPFPFALKEKLAKLAGVAPGRFVQVKSPFQAKEITQNYNPDEDVLIFVRSEKDKNESPKPGGTKKDGSPAYFQPWTGKNVQPFSKHAYFAYLPTVEFGPGITSATQIRKAWPTLNDKRKTALVMSLYPAAQKNSKLAQNVVSMFDQVMGGQVDENFGLPMPGTYEEEYGTREPSTKQRIIAMTNEGGNAFMPGIENTPEYKKGFGTGALPVPYPEGTQQYVNYYKGVMDKAGPKGVAEAKKKRKKKSSKSSKTSKQLRGYFFPGYGYYGFAGSDESGGDGGGGESVREGMVIGCCPNEDINEGKIKDIEDLLARHAQYYLDKEQKEGPLSGQDIHARETIRKKLLAKKKRLQAEKDRTSESTTNVSESIDYLEEK